MKVRILHVNKFLYRRGGAEAYMEAVARLQVAAGHEVAYFGMEHPENPEQRYAASLAPRVEFNPLSRSPLARLGHAGRMLYSFSARRGMECVLDDFRPDVVHCHNIYHHLSPSILRPLARRGTPTVMTLHDFKLACPVYSFYRDGHACDECVTGGLRRAVVHRCHCGSLISSAFAAFELSLHRATNAYDPIALFICPSRFCAEKIAQADVFPERLRTLPHFIHVASIAPKQVPGGPALYMGRLHPVKGVDVLIEAMAATDSAVKLEIAGDGPERTRLQARAEQHAPGRVHFLGRLGRDELIERIRAASVVVLPTVGYENQPMCVLEAFGCGVPVVATGHGGTPELIENEVDGVLVEPGDPRALALALERLVGDPAGAMRMGRAARRKVEVHFTPQAHLTGLEALYREAAAVTPSGRSRRPEPAPG